ncbi:MAG TPA: glyoxalase [Halothiobacillaceae bacterium]|nr:glyoxalase [Halothiobacillaceae bacterium]
MAENGVIGVDHISFICDDLPKSLAFYQAVFDAVILPRPELGFPGVWLDLGGGVVLHLLNLPNPDAGVPRPEHGGRDKHIALAVRSTAEFAEKLARMAVVTTRSRSGRDALFFRDPSGNAIELLGRG